MMTILQAREGLMVHFGLACSSWVVASRASTQRTWMAPMGRNDSQSVAAANTMVARLGALF